MRDFIVFVVKHLVENPDVVNVAEEEVEGRIHYRLSVGSGDIGRVIGKEGRTAKALRTIINAASALNGQLSTLEIMD